MVTLGELASHLTLGIGDLDPSLVLDGIAPLESAGSSDLAFVAEKRYLGALAETRAGCVLLKPEWQGSCPVPSLVTADPYLSYARASALFNGEDSPAVGVHPSAVVDDDAELGTGVSVGPLAHIGAGAVIGDRAVIGPGVVVGAGAVVGAGSRLYPNVVLYHGVTLGKDCIVHSGTVIGSDGFGFARGPDGWEKIHQIGSVSIGDNVEIGAGATIDRGALGDTCIESGVIMDNQVHIAHNCRIGARTALAGCVGIAGSTTIGSDCTFAGQVGVSGHLRICDNVHFNGQARVISSISNPGNYASGTPLEEVRQWRRNAVRFSQLDDMARRLKALENRLTVLDERGGDTERDDDRQ